MRKIKLKNLKGYHLMFSGVSLGPSQVKDVYVFKEKDDMLESVISRDKCTEKELEKVIFNKSVIEVNGVAEPVEEDKPVGETKPVVKPKPVAVLSIYGSEYLSSPLMEFIAVKLSDVDNKDYFSANIGDAKEVIEKYNDGTPMYKKVYTYTQDGGGATNILKYKVDTEEWVSV